MNRTLDPDSYAREVSTDPRQGATLDSAILAGRGVPVEIERRQFAALLRIEDQLARLNASVERLAETLAQPLEAVELAETNEITPVLDRLAATLAALDARLARTELPEDPPPRRRSRRASADEAVEGAE